VAVAIGN